MRTVKHNPSYPPLNMNATKDDFLVENLDKVQPAYADFPGKMFAGRLPADNGDRKGMTMFWMFEPDEQEVPDSLVIWLNGGPGCSSFNCGVMMEHSPVTQPLRPAGFCCLKPTPDLSYNNYTWTKATTMLYVEHPWGTGFSFGKPEPQTEFEASGDLYAFLQNFYQVFDHLADRQLFIFGESYAGMFVPSILRYFHQENLKTKQSGQRRINIGGGAIGNGWMDPAIQGPATIDYSWWHGLIDKPTRDSLLAIWDRCANAGDKTDSFAEGAPFHPYNVQDDCALMWGVLLASGHPNEYDITTFDANVDQVTFTSEGFYNTPDVKKALHAPEDHFWHGCQWGEGRRHLMEKHRQLYMDNDKPLSMAPYIGELLDAGIPLLVYNGDRDMTTNMVGTEMVLNTRVEWKGKDHWLDAPRGLWKTDGYPSGWAKEHGNLTFTVVYNSGHMVPYNQPGPAYDLLVRFLTQQSMIDEQLPQVRSSKPVTPDHLSWIHLYPQGKRAYDASYAESPLLNEGSSASSSSVAASLSGVTSEHSFTAASSNFDSSSNNNMGLFLAFVAGLVVALVSAQFVNRRADRRRIGYSAVPDNA